MKLKRLAPRLTAASTNRLTVVQPVNPDATKRIYGDKWMGIRRRIMVRDSYACAACGLVRNDHEVDHITPLSDGGSNDDANLQLLCSGVGRCHAIKSKREGKGRGGSNVWQGKP